MTSKQPLLLSITAVSAVIITSIVVYSFIQQQQDRQRAREQALLIQKTTYCEKYPDTSTFKRLLDQKFALKQGDSNDNMTFAECMKTYQPSD